METGLVGFVSRFANRRGERAERKLKEKYLEGLRGHLGPVYITRGKILNSFRNSLIRQYVPPEDFMRDHLECYEIVYQAILRLNTGERKIVSLRSDMFNPKNYADKQINISDYNCVAHLFHRMTIAPGKWWSRLKQSDVEIYPVHIELI